MRKDLRRSGPVGLGRSTSSNARDRRNASISASNRLSADKVDAVDVALIPVDSSGSQPTSLVGVLARIDALEEKLNAVIANMKAVRLMDK